MVAERISTMSALLFTVFYNVTILAAVASAPVPKVVTAVYNVAIRASNESAVGVVVLAASNTAHISSFILVL